MAGEQLVTRATDELAKVNRKCAGITTTRNFSFRLGSREKNYENQLQISIVMAFNCDDKHNNCTIDGINRKNSAPILIIIFCTARQLVRHKVFDQLLRTHSKPKFGRSNM